MKAVVHDRYGPPEVLRVEEVDRPSPKDDEVLVRVHATTVTQTDCHMRAARPFFWRFMLGLLRPKRRILGLELAGEIEAVGAAVTRFEEGDRVFGLRNGAHAEYVCVREAGLLAHMPARMAFEEAAAVADGFHQALGRSEARERRPGTPASSCTGHPGPAGPRPCSSRSTTSAPMSPRSATRRTSSSCAPSGPTTSSTTRARTSPSGEDVRRRPRRSRQALALRSRRALEPRGLFVATDGLYNFPLALLTALLARKKVVFAVERPTREDLLLLKELIEAGKYRAVIDRTYPLEQVVEATRYVETFQKTGNVVAMTLRNEDEGAMKAAVRREVRRRPVRCVRASATRRRGDPRGRRGAREGPVRPRSNIAEWYAVTGRP